MSVPTISKKSSFLKQIHLGGMLTKATDGCGMISKRLAQKVFQKYSKHWFPPQVSTSITDISEERENQNFFQNATKTILGQPWAQGTFSNLIDPNSLPKDYVPSAFQIRYRGYKGMLAEFPDSTRKKHSESESELIFTETMLKFSPPCTTETEDPFHNTLEVVGISAPSEGAILSSELIDLFSGEI
jgi:hypothetical protein